MSYIDDKAAEIYRLLGHSTDPQGEDLALYRYYALLCFCKGKDTTAEDVHDAWSAWASEYQPGHRSTVPFNELTLEVQDLDVAYQLAIQACAAGSQH